MKAVVVMFDTLNRRMLEPYGCTWTHTPQFTRLAQRSVTFENCYAGSMPCMPSRREMHTGRHNFLHRSWGPLEPYDESVPQLLDEHGVHTHLATDHYHYWEDGGATYHGRYTTFEFFRGQEGDPWKGQVAPPEPPPDLKESHHRLWRQDWVNRSYLTDEADHPQTLTIDAGIEFLHTNHEADNWLVQIEAFDPHEPFFSYPRHQQHYPHDYDGPHYDWPDYKKVTETQAQLEHVRSEYGALLTMCDTSLGRVLDAMDELDLWDDTLLIVCTDHGFLLGEHGWLGKNVQPWYDETIHTPLFVWDPRCGAQNERRSSLVQTIDIGPMLLDYFGLPPMAHAQGQSLTATVATDEPVREAGLFGIFGGHVCVTDGRYVYMRACAERANGPLYEYTLMPTNMNQRFQHDPLRAATLAPPFAFTDGVPVLRIPAAPMINPWGFGTLLYDLEDDPNQTAPLTDPDLELRMATLLRDLMVSSEAPAEQFQRLGLPPIGPIHSEHLLATRQHEQAMEVDAPAPQPRDFPAGPLSLSSPIRVLLADGQAGAIIAEELPQLTHGALHAYAQQLSPLQIAARTVGLLPMGALQRAAEKLETLGPSS